MLVKLWSCYRCAAVKLVKVSFNNGKKHSYKAIHFAVLFESLSLNNTIKHIKHHNAGEEAMLWLQLYVECRNMSNLASFPKCREIYIHFGYR
jgi:hypothetical protein